MPHRPERLYIVDESGHIAYRGGMGPFNYKPEEAREWLAARYGAVKHERRNRRPTRRRHRRQGRRRRQNDAGCETENKATTNAKSTRRKK